MFDPALVGLISAVTAVVASIVGPLVTLHVGRLQIRASVLSVNRQRWIESFREAVATFCSQVAAAVHMREKIVNGGVVHVSQEPETIKRFEALVLTLARIRLLVDPLDESHQAMLDMMQDQITTLRSPAQDADIVVRIEAKGALIVEHGVGILRREWIRVKRLD